MIPASGRGASGYNYLMPYTWLLFDADGTLFDYDTAEEKALLATFRQMNISYQPAYGPLYRRFNAEVWEAFEAGKISAERLRVERFSRLLGATGVDADALEFSTRYLLNLSLGTDLMPGAIDTLQALRPVYRLALITNGLKDVQRPRLERAGIAHFFEVIAISEEIGVAKPDPAFFDALFAQLGNPPLEQALVIGDGLTSDIQGALQYGLDACWYNPRHLPPQPRYPARFEIHHLGELPALLNGQVNHSSQGREP